MTDEAPLPAPGRGRGRGPSAPFPQDDDEADEGDAEWEVFEWDGEEWEAQAEVAAGVVEGDRARGQVAVEGELAEEHDPEIKPEGALPHQLCAEELVEEGDGGTGKQAGEQIFPADHRTVPSVVP